MVSVQNLATTLAFGALANVLQGCGSSGDETTSTPTTTVTAAPTTTPAPTTTTTPTTTTRPPSPSVVALDDNMMITLYREYREDSVFRFILTADFANYTPGYLAMGFSSDGKMGNGTYIMGYSLSDGTDCVRALTNDGVGSVPYATGKLTFEIPPTITLEGTKMWIEAWVNFHGKRPTGEQNVMYAASSAPVVPETCNVALAANMHHDLKDYVGHKTINFGGAADALHAQVVV